MSALQSIRIVELAQGVAAPLATLRMHDLGAKVIKLEEDAGDWLRHAEPQMPGQAMSAAFFELNRGKLSVKLSENQDSAAAQLRHLLRDADVFVTDKTDAQLSDLGFAKPEDSLLKLNAKLIFVQITPWGDQGPWKDKPGSELTAQAMAGYTRYLSRESLPACRLGADVAGAGSGIFAAQAILAALIARRRNHEQGQKISISLLNSLLSMKSIHLAAQTNPDHYSGPRVGGANYPPEKGWMTKDEPIFFAFGGSVGAQGRPGWVKFIEEAGFNRLLDDKRFDPIGRNSTGYGAKVQELKAEYEREFSRYSGEELVEMIRKYAGNAATYQSPAASIRHPQTTALEVVREVHAKDGQRHEVRAYPARFSKMKLAPTGVAPALGEHTQVVMNEFQAPTQSTPSAPD
jgi:crotonobetainyl-CoA:carnitine CoA-transferase CaiB-like acyl-CoA transferase